MAVDIPGFSSPAAGPEAPLELLSACHERMGRQCATLRRLAAHVAAHGVDAAARTAAASVLRYFDTAAVHHHRDEEEDLFPALIDSMAGSDAVCLHALVDGLTQEHRQLEAAWRRLHGPLQALGDGQPADLDARGVDEFCTLYATHMQREDDELLPMAARLLDDRALADIGQAMRARRGGVA
ncbi:hemerythrin domain-containing protein [Bordetella sp. BOR01]|uniref:hemerythrin domain-containing protein n=1 Tax=Bordetella sp. BOR01 TaxID=2854779 RepID=UPI001C466AB8|nr:hemerythrin domain-containing protein [Bordetella sp. BOR01]MBV7486969.1 hemerythrin domain-containing protein [Bordetella sp. BOR01]